MAESTSNRQTLLKDMISGLCCKLLKGCFLILNCPISSGQWAVLVALMFFKDSFFLTLNCHVQLELVMCSLERFFGCPQPPSPVQHPRFFFLNSIPACAGRPISLP